MDLVEGAGGEDSLRRSCLRSEMEPKMAAELEAVPVLVEAVELVMEVLQLERPDQMALRTAVHSGGRVEQPAVLVDVVDESGLVDERGVVVIAAEADREVRRDGPIEEIEQRVDEEEARVGVGPVRGDAAGLQLRVLVLPHVSGLEPDVRVEVDAQAALERRPVSCLERGEPVDRRLVARQRAEAEEEIDLAGAVRVRQRR